MVEYAVTAIERICFGEDDGFMGRFCKRGYSLNRTIKRLSLITAVRLHEGIYTATAVHTSRSAPSWFLFLILIFAT